MNKRFFLTVSLINSNYKKKILVNIQKMKKSNKNYF